MGSFLDKVGLQHFVEKVKNLLSGYLPLSGGEMDGPIQQKSYGYRGDATITTFNDDGLNCYKEDSFNKPISEVSTASLSSNKLHLCLKNPETNTSGEKILGEAEFNVESCTTKRFILSNDNITSGLIANDSETVVKELNDVQVDNLLAGDTSTISDSKYYVSGANLGRFAQNVSKDKAYTVIYAEGGNVEVTTSAGKVTIEPGINYRIDGDYEITSGTENVSSIVQSGTAQDGKHYFDAMDGLVSIDVYGLDTSNVTDMAAYFLHCSNLSNFGFMLRDIRYWDTRKVITFEGMFADCSSVTGLVLSYWDTRNATNMNAMFAGCTKLTNLNLAGWNTQSVETMSNMFAQCSAITTLTLSEGFGRMKNYVGTLDLSALTRWTNTSIQTLEGLYNRKANGLGVITIKLSSATKNALGMAGINTLTTLGYTVA